MTQELIRMMTGQNVEAVTPTMTAALIVLLAWSFFWKGVGLWHAADRRQTGWFIAILILNTFGVLEIIYLLLIIRLRITGLFRSTRTPRESEV